MSRISMYKGLTSEEVLVRLKTYGPNKVPERKENIVLILIFLKKFTGLTPYAIEIAALISFILGKYVDFAI
ncbi:MAG: cation-transporting P-type ATPase, partial [Desulfurococcaceae archaeon]